MAKEDLKEMQEYKKLEEPVRLGPMTDLAKVTEYFANKLHHDGAEASKHRNSTARTIYRKLGETMDLSQPMLRIGNKKKIRQVTCCRMRRF